ncbi:hypothetical protein [Larkinella terrae]|uniref:DUF4386 family protein n=1 Tax=Larkinella terrae TaxID=2025311 RepID=A0A7K0EJY9_9BACT|nr:hypothetical protein [Larkinella terrae]MRS62180.1 hypothetical protein [Larkinella terrae]
MNKNLSDWEEDWFPGRWVGGVSLVIAPLLLLAGELLRFPFDFFFPSQLKAFDQHPVQLTTAYSLFLSGNILLWPAIGTVAKLIGRSKPGWAVWGGTLVILGLFARTFHYGINHLAFQLVRVQNLEQATKAVADSYGAFHVVSVLSGAIMAGWVVLAIGAYQSGTLGLIRSVALGAMSALMLGVLKGSSAVSVLATSGLCVALIPLGFKVLTGGPKPEIRTVLLWSAGMIALVVGMYFFGQAG